MSPTFRAIFRRHIAGIGPAGNRYKRLELTCEQMVDLVQSMSSMHRPPKDIDYVLTFLGMRVDIRRMEHLLCKTCGAPVEPDEEDCTYCRTPTGAMILLERDLTPELD